MTSYISILRGINVGGNKRIKMDALRQIFVELGCASVQTYIQSGNVVFNSGEADVQTLEKTISAKILETFGFEVPVLVLTASEITAAVSNNPFSTDLAKDPATIHLTFLSHLPDTALLSKIVPTNYLPDEFICLGKVIYIHCPNGYGNTKLTNSFFENKLKLTATCRNLKTSMELAALANK
jgi:uncharacterized protein (DUF1697 family)